MTDEAELASERSSSRPMPLHSTLLYIALLAGIFASEGILNKKAFELFSESDATLWFMVSGLAVAVIVASHLIGLAWKKTDQGRQALPALIVLCSVAVGAALVLGVMRYLTVDNQRQETIRILTQQIDTAQGTAAYYRSQLRSLERVRHLSPAQKQAVVTLKSRIAARVAEAQSGVAARSDARHPRPIDRSAIAVPLFVLLNLFLVSVASVLSYFHYDPDAARSGDWIRNLLRRMRSRYARWQEGRAERREDETRRRQFAQEAGLAATAGSFDEVLTLLDAAYRAACAETEHHHESIIRRYWATHDIQAHRRVGGSWRRPVAQHAVLAFARPPELA